jgi:Family of unknown function (DUF6882)
MHNTLTCPNCRGLPIGGSITDEQFFAFVATCREELAAKQARFQERIAGPKRWSYELADCSFTIGDERFPMTPIGTYSTEYQTWLWAWANEELPPAVRKASLPIQALHAITGFQVFLDPGMPASTSDAENLAALAIHLLGAMVLFHVPPTSDGPTIYMAVHAPRAGRS